MQLNPETKGMRKVLAIEALANSLLRATRDKYRYEIPSSGELDGEPQPSEISLHKPNVSIVPVKYLREMEN